jgi:hypothetical protein
MQSIYFMRKNIALVLLTREPSRDWFSFLNNIITSDVFTVVVDDNCCDVVDDNCCDVVVNIMRMIIFAFVRMSAGKKGFAISSFQTKSFREASWPGIKRLH